MASSRPHPQDAKRGTLEKGHRPHHSRPKARPIGVSPTSRHRHMPQTGPPHATGTEAVGPRARRGDRCRCARLLAAKAGAAGPPRFTTQAGARVVARSLLVPHIRRTASPLQTTSLLKHSSSRSPPLCPHAIVDPAPHRKHECYLLQCAPTSRRMDHPSGSRLPRPGRGEVCRARAHVAARAQRQAFEPGRPAEAPGANPQRHT